MAESPLAEPLVTLEPLRQQDLEPDPPDKSPRIRKGTAVDRRVSVEDKDLRHGRKSKSKRFNRYKGHIASDLDTELILACGITAARGRGRAGSANGHCSVLHSQHDRAALDRSRLHQ